VPEIPLIQKGAIVLSTKSASSQCCAVSSHHIAAMITLLPKNCEDITELAALIAWSPDELANRLLAETLEEFVNWNAGSLEGFLGAIYYFDWQSAQRHWIESLK
jgi:hypothetical protein